MFEHRSDPILPMAGFIRRILLAFSLTLLIVALSVALGTWGYHRWAGFGWDEAFHHTCLILGEHDVHQDVTGRDGRIFSGLFHLYSRLVFVSLITILMLPVLHRVLHHLHLDTEEEEGSV